MLSLKGMRGPTWDLCPSPTAPLLFLSPSSSSTFVTEASEWPERCE